MKRRHLLLGAVTLLAQAQAQAEVDVNTASRAALESLPGLGPALVERLLAGRPFKDWPDLMRRVPGVKAATARKLSAAGLRVAGQAFSDVGGEPG
jgi:competence protein ComEA